MKSGLDALLFNLLILGVLKSSSGQVWRRKVSDLYVIELTTGPKQGVNETVQRRPVLSKVSFIESLNHHQSRLRDIVGAFILFLKRKNRSMKSAFYIVILFYILLLSGQ